jgi:hypoxanthine phosphoribosyltransferase
LIVSVLKGSFMFTADLTRAISLPLAIEFLGLKSYGDEQSSSGVVQITSDLTRPIEGRDVLIVEDIVDTGLTMQYLQKNLATRAPRSLKLCALLNKPARARVATTIDYLGFTIEDVFVVGYGLDWGERYRNLPHLAVVREQAQDS